MLALCACACVRARARAWGCRYGSECKTIYVERKTHLDSWTGNVSVKVRIRAQ